MKARALLIASLMLLTMVRIAHAKDPFEGTAWVIKVIPSEDPKAKSFDETLIFKGSKLTAETMKKKGFEPADYESDTRPGLVGSFSATLKSDAEGSAKWTGQVTAIEIKGELAWTKKDGTVVNYTYTGERKDKQ